MPVVNPPICQSEGSTASSTHLDTVVLCISASEVHVMIDAATTQVQRRSSRPVGQISTCSPVVTVFAWPIAVVAMLDTGIRLGSCSSGPFWCWRRGGRRSRAVQDALPSRWVWECCGVCYHVMPPCTLGLSSGPHGCINYTCRRSHKPSGKVERTVQQMLPSSV